MAQQNQTSKFTTIRISKQQRNKLRRLTEKGFAGFTKLESLSKHVIELGLNRLINEQNN